MPVQYAGILQEVRAVRNSVGVFDVSHMGQVRISGPAALDAVQRLFTNDAAKLAPGRAQYTLMCREDGGILDDLIVYRWDDGSAAPEYLVVANAANRAADVEWMQAHAGDLDAHISDVSDTFALLAVQGPRAPDLVATLAPGTGLTALRSFAHTAARVEADGQTISAHLARTGYTGEDGFEVFCAPDDAPALWAAVVAAGAAPCGLGARDVLRIEASYPLYGHEISEATLPDEAALGWVVKPAKGDFLGRDAVLAARAKPARRRLCGILPEEPRAVPRQDTVVCTDQGEGRVTSGTFSPTRDHAIGIAYVPPDAAGAARLLMRGKEVAARLVDLPFYKRGRGAA